MKVDLSQRTIDELREIFKVSMEDRDLFMRGHFLAMQELDRKFKEFERKERERNERVVALYSIDDFNFEFEGNFLKVIKK